MKAIESEFVGANLKDRRLYKRLLSIINTVSEQPEKSFPQAFETPAELEGFYRFVENPYLNVKDILNPHIHATLQRLESNDVIIVAHDSTEFVFKGERKNLGTTSMGKSPSFFGHFSLAIAASQKEPLGILSLNTFKRGNKPSPYSLRKSGQLSQTQSRKIPSEKNKWIQAIDNISNLSTKTKEAIHVCDSETDSYALLAMLSQKKHRFVIRGCYDRALHDGMHLREELAAAEEISSREIVLSKKGKKVGAKNNKRLVKRETRIATMSIKAKQIILKRSAFVDKNIDPFLPINVVYLLEKNPPDKEPPVEWILLTHEPIESIQNIEAIIDFYRMRWLIEEYFKALKTGCSYEKRQLENFSTLQICLGIFIPIAWFLLRLRTKAQDCESKAEDCIPEVLLDLLREKTQKPLRTSREALCEIARLGGHIKHNGPPGWLTLWRGLRELFIMYRGYQIATLLMSRKRCDES